MELLVSASDAETAGDLLNTSSLSSYRHLSELKELVFELV